MDKIIVAVLVVALLFTSGCTEITDEKNGTVGGTVDNNNNNNGTSGSMSSSIKTELTFADKPLVNRLVELTMKFWSTRDAKNVTAEIKLPEDFQVIISDKWHGNLKKNEVQEMTVRVMATRRGYYTITGSVTSYEGSTTDGSSSRIDMEITENDVIFGSVPENQWYAQGQLSSFQQPSVLGNVTSSMIVTGEPLLYSSFHVSYYVTPPNNINNAKLSMAYPSKGLMVVNADYPGGGTNQDSPGFFAWTGNIYAGRTQKIEITFKVITPGSGIVQGYLQDGGNIIDSYITTIYSDKYTGNSTTPEEIFPPQTSGTYQGPPLPPLPPA